MKLKLVNMKFKSKIMSSYSPNSQKFAPLRQYPSQNENPNMTGYAYNTINQMSSAISHGDIDPYAPSIVQDLL